MTDGQPLRFNQGFEQDAVHEGGSASASRKLSFKETDKSPGGVDSTDGWESLSVDSIG
jgi:hypothetical protein